MFEYDPKIGGNQIRPELIAYPCLLTLTRLRLHQALFRDNVPRIAAVATGVTMSAAMGVATCVATGVK